MRRKLLTVLSLFALVGCEGSAERPTSPTESNSLSTTSTCQAPSIVRPKDGVGLTGERTALRWQVDDICRWENRIEVYDVDSGALVWYDADPKWHTYQIDTYTFEYRYLEFSNLTRGRYYDWRIRTHELASDGTTILQLSPWSSLARFGVTPLTPAVSGSVQNGHPHLSWPAADGADSYEIYREVDEAGTWELWDTTSNTSYTDLVTNVTEYQGADIVPTNPWVYYQVVGVSSAGLRSPVGAKHYFTYTEPIPW